MPGIHVRRDEFELAEYIWEAADPCLSEAERQATLEALHTGETWHAILILVTALSRTGHPLPNDLHREFSEWLRQLPEWDTHNGCSPVQLELHIMAADVQVDPDDGVFGGRPFGDATLCYWIFDDAGVVDESHECQADVLRTWLEHNRPSPSLRADIHSSGFGYLLVAREFPPSGGLSA